MLHLFTTTMLVSQFLSGSSTDLRIPMMQLEGPQIFEAFGDGNGPQSSFGNDENSGKHLIDDCLGTSLEYLGNKTYLRNFRTTSKRFNQIYAQYKIRQNAKFRDFKIMFQNRSQQNKYHSLNEMLNSIPLIPDLYVGFRNKSDLRSLFELHRRSNVHELRGLSAPRNNAFLSVMLWDDLDRSDDPILLVSYVAKGIMKFVVRKRSRLALHPTDFGVSQLNELLFRKQIRFLDGPLSGTLWTLGRQRCGSQLRCKFCGNAVRRITKCYICVSLVCVATSCDRQRLKCTYVCTCACT